MKGLFQHALVLFIFAATAPLCYSEDKAASSATTDIGKLYQLKCANCHGKDGKGKPSMAKVMKLDKPEMLDISRPEAVQKKREELVETISKGRKKMPAFGKKLKAEEIDGLADYVRSLVSPK